METRFVVARVWQVDVVNHVGRALLNVSDGFPAKTVITFKGGDSVLPIWTKSRKRQLELGESRLKLPTPGGLIAPYRQIVCIGTQNADGCWHATRWAPQDMWKN